MLGGNRLSRLAAVALAMVLPASVVGLPESAIAATPESGTVSSDGATVT